MDTMQQNPFIFSSERKWRIKRHLAFWAFWWIFQGVLYSFIAIKSISDYFTRLPISLIESFCFLFNHMFLAYMLMYFVIPKFLLQQRYWETAIWTFALFVVSAALSAFTGMVIVDFLREQFYDDIYVGPPRNANIHMSLLAGLRGGITVGGIAAAIKLMKYWYMKEQRNLQLRKENVEAQLQLLKGQVHPHFLFNTLNNIYSHTQGKAPVAAKMVTALSDLLRFILYEGSQSLVPLTKEITMVQDYIDLEKMRYGNRLEIHTEFPDHIKGLQIAPLILLPFVENCFKHGASTMLDQPWINMSISIRGRHLQMKLLNGKASGDSPSRTSSGIGINNVRKRLDLLYPERHELSIQNDEDVFIVNLKIELTLLKDANAKLEPIKPVHA